MNILILTTHLDPGGISSYTVNLAKGLSKEKHKVWVACSGGEWLSKFRNTDIRYKVIPIKTKSIGSIKIFLSFLKLRRFVKEEAIDVVHCNTRVTQFLGFIIYKVLLTPYVSAFHGFYRSGIFRRLFKFSGCLTIAVSEAVKKHLVEDLGINKNKIRVVHNGLDTAEFKERGAKREDFGFKKSDYLLGILGRISKEKGHFLAVAALNELVPKYENIYLLVSGKGKLENSLRMYVDSYKLKDRVRFLNCEANQFLDIIDLLLVPSEKEGFGYSIIEAFIKEVPVIGYDVGGISEIIKDRINGILFYNYSSSALAEKIEEIISHENLRRAIVASAKEDVLYFSIERMAIDTDKVYQEIL